ncbi:MAG: magnesium transporter [Anaerocolumna aminovalerica]|uniref:magnesium transporter n=1 Tax=Anaerocolumna aminovalerica TaxID=1527 RepID=UPI002914A105|nr:magnesium transporter [Anaerocolumna aminovalerica]MDU6266249.1 magnesium transporter [Anaerocolumna aminovalerica]
MTNIELLTLLEENKLKLIHEELSKYNPVDLASLLSKLDEEKLVIVFRILDKEKAAEVFSYMENDLQQTLIKTLSKQDIKTIFNSMYADDAVDFLSDMPANVVTQLLENVDNETRADINYLLQYSEDSAGSIMTVEFIELHPTMTVKQALDKIRKVGIDSETVYTCYVVVKHKLLGIVSAKDLMIRDSETLISDLMKDNYVSIKTTDDRETAANLFRKYGLLAIPVVDSEGCIVGIVTFDDAIDVLTDETTEDMQKMAAMTANDDPYLKTSVWKHAKHRIPWLLILMFSATITGSIISNYEAAFAIIPLLVSFIPMLMDTGGNCGSQSSTLVIRGLAVEELQFSDTLKIVWKEFRVSLIVGVTLAVANGLRIVLMYKDIQLALVVSLSLVGTIIIAKIVGCLLPILAKKCKLDPAIMAAPIITTVVDTFSIIIYFNIATLILKL